MISNCLTPLNLIKLVAFIFLTYMFVNMFSDDLQKFKNKITTTGTKIRPPSSEKKKLPCITICAWSAFRKRGFYFTNKDYIENTYDIADFFADQTLQNITNKTTHSYKEVPTIYHGRCYKICSFEEQPLGTFIIWELKNNFNYKFYIHNDGDEFWLTGGVIYFVDMAQTTLEVNRTDGMKAGLFLISFYFS